MDNYDAKLSCMNGGREGRRGGSEGREGEIEGRERGREGQAET